MTDIANRKQAHLDICQEQDVEHGDTRLNGITLIGKSLPELSVQEISTQTSFLKKQTQSPIFISCMTGGSTQGADINKHLAMAAEECQIAMGLGSMRILFEQPSKLKDFMLRKYAPTIPLFANLGATQLSQISHSDVYAMLEKLGVDALALHLNPAQELCQENGEDSFQHIISQINIFISECPIPVIVKETGYGILPTETRLLLGYGAFYVDIAGSGGSNWAKIEHLQHVSTKKQGDRETRQVYDYEHDIYQLGIPTGLLMLSLYRQDGILASGGIRTPLDVIKCVLLGAKGVGLALPLVTHATQSARAVSKYLQGFDNHMKKLMLLFGAKNIEDISDIPFYLDVHLQGELISFCNALNIEIAKKLQNKLTVGYRSFHNTNEC